MQVPQELFDRRIALNFGVYLGVRTCDIFLCFGAVVNYQLSRLSKRAIAKLLTKARQDLQ